MNPLRSVSHQPLVIALAQTKRQRGCQQVGHYNAAMILAGIDEAGYGPLLGPLVVGCSAFEVDADPSADLPCLWQRLRKLVSKTRSRTGRKLHINDSKQVYTPSQGLKELERAVLAVSATTHGPAETLDKFLEKVCPHALPQLRDHPWYIAHPDEVFPLATDAMATRLFANGLAAEMKSARAWCVHLAARVVPERHLNRMFDTTRNKSSVLFSLAAIHLDHLLRQYGQQNLVIFCDRQGGREHYGHLLRMMFEEWSLEIIQESEGDCEYCLTRNGHAVRLIFREKAEAQCLPVALASMLSKYLRESLMHRFNLYWKTMLSDLQPTAGYYQDGQRFLRDIDVKRRELGIPDQDLIRSR